MGSLLPPPLPPGGESPLSFAQIYITHPSDPSAQRDARLRHHSRSPLNPQTLETLHTLIQEHNPYAAIFKTAGERIAQRNADGGDVPIRIELSIIDPAQSNEDQRCCNRPTAQEIAVIITGGGEQSSGGDRDIIIEEKGSEEGNELGGRPKLKRISELSPHYAGLRWPLWLMFGEQGWSPSVTHGLFNEVTTVIQGWEGDENSRGVRSQVAQNFRGRDVHNKFGKKISQCDYFAYQLSIRSSTVTDPSNFPSLHLLGALFQEICVYARVHVYEFIPADPQSVGEQTGVEGTAEPTPDVSRGMSERTVKVELA